MIDDGVGDGLHVLAIKKRNDRPARAELRYPLVRDDLEFHHGLMRSAVKLRRLQEHAADLTAGYDAMQGPDPADPACAQRPAEPTLPLLEREAEGLRIAVAGGYFRTGVPAEAEAAVAKVAAALGLARKIELPEAARAAAYVITAAEPAVYFALFKVEEPAA
jgi:hypothetical protein